MLSKEQYDYFRTYPGFKTQRDGKPKAEFYRLSAFQGWAVGSKTFQKHYVTFKRLSSVLKQSGPVEGATEAFAKVQIYDNGNENDKYDRDLGGVSVPLHQQSPSIVTPLAYVEKAGKFATQKRKPDLAAIYAQQANDVLGGDELNKTVLTALCADLGISPIPGSNKKCKEALRHVHVNIYDFLSCKQGDQTVTPVFHSYKAFCDYSMQQDKIFPKKHAKASKVLRFLLREIV